MVCVGGNFGEWLFSCVFLCLLGCVVLIFFFWEGVVKKCERRTLFFFAFLFIFFIFPFFFFFFSFFLLFFGFYLLFLKGYCLVVE